MKGKKMESEIATVWNGELPEQIVTFFTDWLNVLCGKVFKRKQHFQLPIYNEEGFSQKHEYDADCKSIYKHIFLQAHCWNVGKQGRRCACKEVDRRVQIPYQGFEGVSTKATEINWHAANPASILWNTMKYDKNAASLVKITVHMWEYRCKYGAPIYIVEQEGV